MPGRVGRMSRKKREAGALLQSMQTRGLPDQAPAKVTAIIKLRYIMCAKGTLVTCAVQSEKVIAKVVAQMPLLQSMQSGASKRWQTST